MKITLIVKNRGPVPTFKNNKRVAINPKNGKSFIMTDHKTKEWMKGTIQSFESQLFCATRIGDGVTSMGRLPHSLIASSLPLDDSWTWIPQLNVSAELVEKGLEGATIIIEKTMTQAEARLKVKAIKDQLKLAEHHADVLTRSQVDTATLNSLWHVVGKAYNAITALKSEVGGNDAPKQGG